MTRPSNPKYGSVIVVGLRGLIGAGKTTVAEALRQKYQNVHVRSMAGPLKRGLATMGITKTETPAQYRKMAQTIGAQLRAENPDWWVIQARKEVQRIACLSDEILKTAGKRTPPPCVIVFDDIRYRNEAQLTDLLFFLRPTYTPPAPLGAIEDHESEVWNQAYNQGDPAGNSADPSTTLITNEDTRPDAAADAIMTRIAAFRTA